LKLLKIVQKRFCPQHLIGNAICTFKFQKKFAKFSVQVG